MRIKFNKKIYYFFFYQKQYKELGTHQNCQKIHTLPNKKCDYIHNFIISFSSQLKCNYVFRIKVSSFRRVNHIFGIVQHN